MVAARQTNGLTRIQRYAPKEEAAMREWDMNPAKVLLDPAVAQQHVCQNIKRVLRRLLRNRGAPVLIGAARVTAAK